MHIKFVRSQTQPRERGTQERKEATRLPGPAQQWWWGWLAAPRNPRPEQLLATKPKTRLSSQAVRLSLQSLMAHPPLLSHKPSWACPSWPRLDRLPHHSLTLAPTVQGHVTSYSPPQGRLILGLGCRQGLPSPAQSFLMFSQQVLTEGGMGRHSYKPIFQMTLSSRGHNSRGEKRADTKYKQRLFCVTLL